MATVYVAGSTNQAILLAEASSGGSASGESNNQLSKPGLTIRKMGVLFPEVKWLSVAESNRKTAEKQKNSSNAFL